MSFMVKYFESRMVNIAGARGIDDRIDRKCRTAEDFSCGSVETNRTARSEGDADYCSIEFGEFPKPGFGLIPTGQRGGEFFGNDNDIT